MHIAINCRSFSRPQVTGIGRYASSLVESLSCIDSVNRYSLYTTRAPGEIKKRISRNGKANFCVRFDWLQRGAARTLRAVDVYHAPGPEVVPDLEAGLIVTVHDLIYKTYPQGHTQDTLMLTDGQFRSFIPKAARIICSSRNTQNDLHRYFPQAREKSCCIYQGVDKKIFYPLGDPQRDQARRLLRNKGLRDPFVLFVGTLEPRKNLKGLVEAFAILKGKKTFRGKLAVIGMAGWKTEWLAQFLERSGVKEDIVFLGYVNTDELRAFYNLAEVFVFPSFYEGFGYPIVEAFSCGAAVVTSNVSSCPEIAGQAALTVDPNNSEGLAGAIARIIHDRGLKASLCQKALDRAREFDNLKTARETLRVYEEIYNSKWTQDRKVTKSPV